MIVTNIEAFRDGGTRGVKGFFGYLASTDTEKLEDWYFTVDMTLFLGGNSIHPWDGRIYANIKLFVQPSPLSAMRTDVTDWKTRESGKWIPLKQALSIGVQEYEIRVREMAAKVLEDIRNLQ